MQLKSNIKDMDRTRKIEILQKVAALEMRKQSALPLLGIGAKMLTPSIGKALLGTKAIVGSKGFGVGTGLTMAGKSMIGGNTVKGLGQTAGALTRALPSSVGAPLRQMTSAVTRGPAVTGLQNIGTKAVDSLVNTLPKWSQPAGRMAAKPLLTAASSKAVQGAGGVLNNMRSGFSKSLSTGGRAVPKTPTSAPSRPGQINMTPNMPR